MRIRGAKTELEEAGLETEGMASSTAKLRSEIKALSGVDIMLDSNTFKSTYQIMNELANKWQDLTDIQQASVTELIAGKRQGNIVSSLMNNFDIAEKALETSLNSAGSAMKEHEKWQESLEARINKLKAAWQSLSQSFMSSNFLKVALDVVIKFVDVLDKLINKIGALPTLLGGFSLFAGISQILSAGKIVGGLSSFKGLLSVFKDAANIIPILTKAFPKAAAGIKVFTDALAGSTGMSGLAKAATIGKGAISGLWTVIAAHPIVATVAAVAAAVAIFNKFHESAKELKERIEDVTTAYRDEHGELVKLKGDFDTTNEDSMISKYGELSKGVNALGENVSLTADEYSEYQSIVDTIANQFPSLVSGYNSQGDAILSCAGSVDELTNAYKNLIREQNSEVLDTGKDIFKDFENDLRKTSAYYKESYETLDELGNTEYKEHFDTKHLDTLESLITLKGNDKDVETLINELSQDEITRISGLLDDYGIKRDVLGSGEKGWETQREHIIRALGKDKADIKKILEEASADLNAYAEDLGTVTEAYFSDAFLGDYSHMSERMQNIINQITSGFDSSFYADFLDEKDPYEALTKYFGSMLEAFDDLSNAETKDLENAFNLKTQFNGGDISYGEYVKGLEDVGKLVDGMALDEEVKTQIKLSLGLNEDGLVEEYESLVKRLSGTDKNNVRISDFEIDESAAKKFLDGLSAEELSVATKIIPELSENGVWETVEDLKKAINREMAVQGLIFDLNFEVEATSIEAFNTAMAESVSGAGLSSDSIEALKGRYAELESQGWDLSSMFEETSNGIHLNRRAVNELEQAYAKQKQTDIKSDLEALEKEYKLLNEDIENCNDASKRASLYVQRDAIVQQINDAATLAAQYEGLTSAYNDWLSAEESGQERDMYEQVIEGFENIGDEISRGWYDDGTIKFLELMTGETDLAGKSASELKKIWKDLDKNIKNTSYSVKDFFTTDEDGNSTSTGVYNFLKSIEELKKNGVFKGKENLDKLIQRDKKTGKITAFNFDVVGGDEAIAEALGISEELVQIMLRAADDAGFVVTLDGNYTQLADLKTSAETANDTLKKLKSEGFDGLKDTDLNFDFSANNLQDLNTQLEKSLNVLDKFKDKNGKLKTDSKGNLIEGAEEALEIASYFTATLDKLTEPVYMQLETNQVEKDMQEPLEKMQEFERLSKEKHQLELVGDTEGIKNVEKEMNEIVDYIYKNDDLKAKLEIEGLSKEEIKAKLEKGEIEIPATVDIQLEMSEDIKDMRLMMMRQLGYITDEQLKLELEYDVDYSAVEEYTPEQQKAVVKYFAEHDEVDDYTPEQKKAIVKLVAEKDSIDDWSIEDVEATVKYFVDESDLEKWTPKEKRGLAKYIADGGELDGWTPEEKRGIAKYIADGNDVDGWTPEEKKAIAKYIADGGDVSAYTPEEKRAFAKYLADGGDPAKYQPPNKTATAKYNKDSTEPDSYQPKDKEAKVTFWAQIKKIGSDLWGWITGGGGGAGPRKVVNGTANINGTAFVDGTADKFGKAFRRGDWRTKKTETALTGELGPEIVVTPDNQWYTVGDSGAEFARIPRGSIVFNHRQSEELLKNGKVVSDGGRAKVYANGTAFAHGTAYSSGTGGGEEITVGVNKNTGASYTKSADSKNDFEETIDWIETAIDRIERAIDQLDTKASSTYRSWSERNSNLAKQISKVSDEIALQQSAYDEYMAAANAVGLSSSYAAKVRNGTIDIETIKDEGLKAKIDDYENWYSKALDCKDAILELQETESSLFAQRFENIQTQYDGILQGYEHTEAMLNEYIAQAEEKGYVVSKKYYQALIDNEKSNIAELKKEQADLIAERDNAVAEGKIVKGSEAWYEQCAAIDEITQSIEEGSTAVLEYARAIEEIDWSIFDLIQERISDVSEEADFLIELMSNKKLFEDDGKLTSQGLVTMGLHAQNYNTHMYAADEYGAEVAKLNKQIANDPYDQELINRRNELIELQKESILAAEDEKNAIRDLVEEGINLELDALQELIDKKNEELESERDLYEYSKKVKEQTKEIADIEKMLSSYSGDDSEEAKAKIQELKVSLEEAETDLQETEWDRYIDQQSQILDTLYNEYELILNTRLDNIDYLLEQVIETINLATSADGNIATALGSDGAIAIAVSDNAASIKDTLASETNKVGITLSNAMNSIWSVGEGNAKSVLTMYGEDFRTKSTTIITTLNGIKTDIAAMVDDVDKDAQKKTTANKTTTSAKKNPTTSSSSSKKPTTTTKKPATTSSSGDGKPKVGDKVKFVSGQYYYDSQGTRPLGYHNRGKEVYITSINTKSWATHPYHISTGNKLGKGDLGWLKLNQLSGYAVGKQNFLSDEVAWTQENGKEFIVRPSDGAILTPIAKGDSVLTSAASSNIWDMANSPAEFIKDNLGIGSADVPNNSNVNNEIVQHFENITFSLPNVHGYNDLLTEMQRDPKFEKLILSMTIGQIAGKSKLVKGKSIRN